jgi:hypothetical protein
MNFNDILITAHLSGEITELQLTWLETHFDSLGLRELDLLGELGEFVSQGLVNIHDC